MNKRLKTFLIFYTAMLLLFIFNKWVYAQNNTSYKGKIVNMAVLYVQDYEGSGYSESYYPRVEYYKGKDTLIALNEGWNSSFLNTGDQVTVIVDNDDDSIIELNTLFNYWMPIYSIILFFFIGLIGCVVEVTDLSR